MSHRFPRLRFFQHNPSGPHSVADIIDHVVITVSDFIASLSLTTQNGYIGDVKQFTATAFGSRGQVVSGSAVTWRSDFPNVVSITSAGLATFLAAGSATITASVDGRDYATAFVVSQAQDGSYADVIFAAAIDGVPIRNFRDARLAISDGVGVQRIPDVRGDHIGYPALVVIQNGGGNTIRPTLDPVKKTVRTGGLGSSVTLVSENWNGDSARDFSQGIWKLTLDAVVSVGSGTAITGVQRPDRVGVASIQGAFDSSPQTVDSFFYTDGNVGGAAHVYFWNTKRALGSTSCGMFGWFLPPGNGVDNSLNSTPWAKSLQLGVEGPRTLPHGQVSANQFTAFPSGACRDFFGPEPSGLQATPSIGTADYIYATEIEFGAPPTYNVIRAWKRYAALHPAYVAPVRSTAKYVMVFGHSLVRGNGASDLVHAIPGATQTHLGAGYQCDNLGIAGDGTVNGQIEPYLTYRLGGCWSDERDHDWFVYGPDYVNDANNSVPVATCLAGADTITNRAKALWPSGKLKALGVTETTEAPNPPGIPNQPAFNTGIIGRVGTTFDAVARPDLNANIGTNSDPTNATYWLDGEHRKDAGYDIDGTVNAAAIVAAGG